MKNLKKNVLMFLAIGSLFLVGCKNDTSAITQPLTSADVTAAVQTDDATDEIDNAIDNAFTATEYASKNSELKATLNSCATTTIVIDGTTKTVTVDFGTGCTTPNGNVLSGKIIMNYNKDTSTQSVTINYTLENFYFNDLSVEATNSIVHVRQNDNGHPQSVITFDTKVTWPDGTFISRKGTRTREWIEGYDTLDFGDNVFLVTGNWEDTFKDGSVVTATVTTPLRREMTCRYFVSGVIQFEKNGKTATLDFGDGTCDNTATFTGPDGVAVEITLRGMK